MRIAISSNLRGGKGLLADFLILKALLEPMGHEVFGWEFDNCSACHEVDMLIFLEVLNPAMIRWAKRRLYLPNVEWHSASNNYLLSKIDMVLAKTRDAERIFKPIAHQVYYTGFTAQDFYDPAVKKKRAFLHNAGQSQAKNSLAVIEAWRRFSLPYPLTILAEHYTGNEPNITYIKSVDKPTLARMKNEFQFHIMASAYEGYGQSIWESIGCGAVVVSGKYPPFDEIAACPNGLRIPSEHQSKQGLATTHSISPVSVMGAADNCWRLSEDDCGKLGRIARESFLTERANFERRFTALIQHTKEIGEREPLRAEDLMP